MTETLDTEYGYLRHTGSYRTYVLGVQGFLAGALLVVSLICVDGVTAGGGFVRVAVYFAFFWEFITLILGVVGAIGIYVNTGGGIRPGGQREFFRMFGRDLVSLPWRWRAR